MVEGSVTERTDDGFSTFAEEAEPRLRRALVSGYGTDVGRDAVAEALAYAWEHWEELKEMKNPIGYLYRVGGRRAVRQRKHPPRLPLVPDDHQRWIEPGLPAALANLTQKQRTATMLIHAYDWTYREVGELLDVSPTTVEKHVERAMRKLRSSLGVTVDA